MDKKMFKKWKSELDSVLLTHDVDEFKTFYQKWKLLGVYELPMPKSDQIIRASMEKMVCNMTNFPEYEKQKASEWLIANGFTTEL